MKFGAGADGDSFGKVNAQITDLIERLQKEASAETSHSASCDEAQVLLKAHSVKPFCEGVQTAGCQVQAGGKHKFEESCWRVDQ